MATKASAKNIDFSGVKDRGNFNKKRIPSGDYAAIITGVEDAEAKDGVFQYLVSIKIKSRPSSVFPYYCKLQDNQLWKLRNLLIAAGIIVPKRKFKVDPNKLIGKTIGVTVEDDEYDGKPQSNIAGVFPASELTDGHEPESDDDDDAEDEPEDDTLDVDEDEEPEDEEPEADPYADMDRTALKAELKKLNPDFRARKSQTDDDLRAELRAATSDDTDDDEDEEEPPPPPKKTRTTRAKKAAPKASQVTDEELEELDIDDL